MTVLAGSKSGADRAYSCNKTEQTGIPGENALKRLDGKVILVAGGGGIGDELAQRYAREGAAIVIGDLNADRARETAAAILAAGGSAHAVRLDGGDERSIAESVRIACETYGGLDGLHANFAALNLLNDDTDVLDVSLDVFDGTMQVNARGFLLCTRHALPPMLARGRGSIVYTSSGAAHGGEPQRVSYAMSKAAGQALMRHVAMRYGREGIRANAIAPGLIRHKGWDAWAPEILAELERNGTANMAVDYPGRPEDIASIGTLLMSDEGAFITGQVISVDGGTSMRP